MNEEYFSWLALDATNEEFEEEVSSIIEREENNWIVGLVDRKLREHVELLKELYDSDNLEDQKTLLNAVSNISVKLGILRAMMDSYEDNNNLATELEEDPGDVKIIFAKNINGNMMAAKHFEDIKKYGDDKYEALMGLLGRLAAGDTDFNTEKQRPLISSKALKGIYELKDFQIRLIYMRENEYTVVIGALVKKDDNALKIRSSLENMKKQSEKYRQAIRNGKLDMDKELKESGEFMESLSVGVKKGI